MNNQLSVVHQQNVLGQTFKVYGTVEDPLFLAKDVAEWIEHSNTRMMMKKVDSDEKVVNNVYTPGGLQETWFITEDGLYEVLMQSRKPIAKSFKKEVKKILKQIRLTGGIVQTDREAEFIDNYFPSFSEDVKKMMVLDLHTKNQELKKTIEVQAPKVEKYEDFLEVDGSLTVTQVVDKLREFNSKPDFIRSAVSLNKFLNEKGIQYKRGSSWYVYQKYDYLVKECYVINRQVQTHTGYGNQLRWTPKGVDFIIELLEETSEKLNKIQRLSIVY